MIIHSERQGPHNLDQCGTWITFSERVGSDNLSERGTPGITSVRGWDQITSVSLAPGSSLESDAAIRNQITSVSVGTGSTSVRGWDQITSICVASGSSPAKGGDHITSKSAAPESSSLRGWDKINSERLGPENLHECGTKITRSERNIRREVVFIHDRMNPYSYFINFLNPR